ncbi:Fur family transcriptional regulator [Aquamicrobium sp. LC103]|uniref:Fur family transcriptional regulator n=1 Tax=Aquamicrobium sp. LC103 TaxID=1120658 RepID=UPI00063EC421|nr:Fur family transcriptional regulator [Aquamicrobium sp. LC103]TKT74350.1 transcriptional repressor [Aquamicrobium sp. LC103]
MSGAITVTANAHSNRRPGRNRQLVLDALERAQKPLGAYELLELLRDDGLRSPPQVYRALEQLIDDGAVHKIESLSAFAVCTAECGNHGHAAFAICRNCGRTSEFHDAELDRLLRRLARKEGFRTTATTVELSGLCESCAHG